ncbi:Suppressor of glycerol defect protein [Sphaerulina musiva]
MSRSTYGGPKLPKDLLEKVSGGRIAKRNHQQTRKEKRKAERTDKKRHIHPRSRVEVEQIPKPRVNIKVPARTLETTTSVPKKRQQVTVSASEDEFEDFDGEESNGAGSMDGKEEDEEDDYPIAAKVPKAVQAKLDNDDAEIRALEKKLGMRGKSKKKVGDDELDWLIGGGLSSEDEDGFPLASKKRAAPEDEDWLRQKRRKAEKQKTTKVVEPELESSGSDESDGDDFAEFATGDEDGLEGGSEEGEQEDDSEEEIENPFSADELSDDGLEEDDESVDQAPKERENPYVAPTVKNAANSSTPAAGKYVPPSMRKSASGDAELLQQLQRQLNGQMNKLSEANMLSILAAVQDIYTKNARQHVTSVLIELFKNRVCDRSVLTDNEMILLAGFATAVYRTTGVDFGAQLLEAMVNAFDQYHAESNSEAKQTLNILAFLSNLYTLHAIGCEVIFDYIRILLENFSESNTELLLRVIRISGQQLRQDDPTALKDIVLLLQRAINKAGGAEQVSVRTKFMIETIHNLKNNRTTSGGAGSVSSVEHTARMKKTLGQTKSQKTSEPLRISLADIRDSEKKGKWWLVGASWRDPAKMANSTSTTTILQSAPMPPTSEDSSDSDPTELNLDALARAQGMNTDVRRGIFISVAGAVDPVHAHLRLQKLNLKNKQQLEIPRVLIHCVSAEPVYNHFYTLVALKFCSGRRMAKAWQFALFDIFRRIEADADAEEGGEELSVRMIYNVAKLYATMVAENLLRITILKPLQFMALSLKARIFAGVLITTLLVQMRKKHGKESFGSAVEECFKQAHGVPDMVKGLDWFLESELLGSDIFGSSKREKKVVAAGVEYAVEVLRDEKMIEGVAFEGRGGEESD